MQLVRLVVIFAVVLCVLMAVGCRQLALKGAAKYRVEVVNAANEIKFNINETGVISPNAERKFREVLARYKDDPLAKKASYLDALEIGKQIDMARADPSKQFQVNEQIKFFTERLLQDVKTEENM